MIEILIVSMIVFAASVYWLGRLYPPATPALWRAGGSVLKVVRAPQAMQRAAQKRAAADVGQAGCGGCKGCSTKGGCH